MGPEHLALLIPITALCIPIVAIITSHQRKLAEIKARMTSGLSAEVRAELNEIKEQLASLRETTTRFDMAFDAALTRLESRMDDVDARTASLRSAGSGNSVGAEEAATIVNRR